MNRFQLTVLIAAMTNLALLLLFPPFDIRPSGFVGPANFDSFHPIFRAPENGFVNTSLLYLETLPVLVNSALAWLLLEGAPQHPSSPRVRWQRVLQWLVAVDVLLMLLFPPFETRTPGTSVGEGAFEGFDFVLSGNPRRGIFLPLLYAELALLALNAAALWAAFAFVARSYEKGLSQRQGSGNAALGRSGSDRRQQRDPNYQGAERRSGIDRRDRAGG